MKANTTDYSHIQGWGADLDRRNRPAVPKERIPARDIGVHWDFPEQQPVTVEILKSTERPAITAVFGTTNPPRGLSGLMRRFAFKFSENDLRHWFILLFADRVNMVEGIIEDLARGHVPNVLAEMGIKAEIKHNKKGLVVKVLAVSAMGIALGYLLTRRKSA